MLFFCVFQSPPKGATIPYRPKPQVGGPVILAGGQAYTIQGNYAVPAHSDVSTVLPLSAPHTGQNPPSLNTTTLTSSHFATHHPSHYASHAHQHQHHPLLAQHLTHHPLHPNPLHASVAGLADPLLKSGHLQAALPPVHLVADAVSLLFFVVQRPPSPEPDATVNRIQTHNSYLFIFINDLNTRESVRERHLQPDIWYFDIDTLCTVASISTCIGMSPSFHNISTTASTLKCQPLSLWYPA